MKGVITTIRVGQGEVAIRRNCNRARAGYRTVPAVLLPQRWPGDFMSERTAQCRECTDVFECGPTGRLPVLCPKCRKDGKERPSATPRGSPAKRTPKAHTNGNGSIENALAALRTDLEVTQARAAQLVEAIDALAELV